MRRRRIAEAGQVPPMLWTFDAEDWSGSPVERVHAWCAARREWARTNPWPGGAVEMIVQNRAVRRQVMHGGDR
ncbi:hypothetical protein [Rhodococcus pyridinivorans]|uniref:hypothetical protein n=1 Tax=Rhodococcus pyridinivorans TaxID=103816 RepID=UPI000BA21381|nr:hypothetical protein [Rhodococcus pyridinivorans]